MSETSGRDQRLPWVEPTVTRHESLLALTQQRLHPATGRPLDPNDPLDRQMLASIPGSQGFFP